MADDEMIPNHITLRKGVCQYVRRIPEDLRDAFPYSRIQRSLGTRDQRLARERALELDRHWDRQFAEARRRKGLAVEGDGAVKRLDTSGWDWPDWESLARWIEVSLCEEDWRARLAKMPGRLLDVEPDLKALPWRHVGVVAEHIALRQTLTAMTVETYGLERLGFIQGHVRRLGVTLARTDPHHQRFMAACLAAELRYLQMFFQREGRIGGLDHPHPDTIEGPWRAAAEAASQSPPYVNAPPQPAIALQVSAGRTLADCRDKWIQRREAAKKEVREPLLREMNQAISAFETHTGVRDIGMIERHHVLAWRDHLETSTSYAAATVNKKVSFISTLMSTALNVGWVKSSIKGGLFVEVPEDQDKREPYKLEDLATIFDHPIFTDGQRLNVEKAGGELQYWLPLISCLQGLISSEILQLRPDSIKPHPDAPNILCLEVTNAGGRSLKALARKRWAPIRQELLDLGLREWFDQAQRTGRASPWSAVQLADGDINHVSGYFSSFWTSFARELGLNRERTSLYSLRHAFQDAVAKVGGSEGDKKGLMGHAETGMTRRYGTKEQPRVVDIVKLNGLVQRMEWPFLAKVRPYRP